MARDEASEQNLARIQAAHGFVDLMVPRADDPFRLMWYGWALREAFIAGAAWQEKSNP